MFGYDIMDDVYEFAQALRVTPPVVYTSQKETTHDELKKRIFSDFPIPTKTLFDFAIIPLQEQRRDELLAAHQAYCESHAPADDKRSSYLNQLAQADLTQVTSLESLATSLEDVKTLEAAVFEQTKRTRAALNLFNGLQEQYGRPVMDLDLVRGRYAQEFLLSYVGMELALLERINSKRERNLIPSGVTLLSRDTQQRSDQ